MIKTILILILLLPAFFAQDCSEGTTPCVGFTGTTCCAAGETCNTGFHDAKCCKSTEQFCKANSGATLGGGECYDSTKKCCASETNAVVCELNENCCSIASVSYCCAEGQTNVTIPDLNTLPSNYLEQIEQLRKLYENGSIPTSEQIIEIFKTGIYGQLIPNITETFNELTTWWAQISPQLPQQAVANLEQGVNLVFQSLSEILPLLYANFSQLDSSMLGNWQAQFPFFAMFFGGGLGGLGGQQGGSLPSGLPTLPNMGDLGKTPLDALAVPPSFSAKKPAVPPDAAAPPLSGSAVPPLSDARAPDTSAKAPPPDDGSV